MAKAVKLSDGIVNDAKRYAKVYNRSVPGQIEHWSKIGKIMEENPEMTYEFVKDILLSVQEAEDGLLENYSFGKRTK